MMHVLQWHENTKHLYSCDEQKKVRRKITYSEGELPNAVKDILRVVKKNDVLVIVYGMRRFSFVRSVTLLGNVFGYATNKDVAYITTSENANWKEIKHHLNKKIKFVSVLKPHYVFPPNITARKVG